MSFAWPHLLWLVLAPLGFLAWELTHRRRAASLGYSKILRAEAGRHSLRLSSSTADSSPGRGRIRPWLWCGLAFAIVALARPQWGRLEEPVFDQAREILIAIDLSRSMLTPDVRPSRLDRAKLLTQSLLEKLQGERVGLVVFSGTAFLQSPLSADYEILREFLPALTPDYLPEGGTNYRALIDTSLGAFASTASADRFLIVLSDGEATDDHWRDRVDELKQKGIRVIGLGVGTSAGAMIPDGAGGFVKDERGAVVLSKLESATLRELAEKTNGVYQDASTWVDLSALINATVEAGHKGKFLEKNTVRLVERFQWPLALALWFLFVSFYYEFPVKPKPRALKLSADPAANKNKSSGASGAAAVAATAPILLFAIFVALRSTSFAAPAKPDAPQPPLLAKIVGRLSTLDQPNARDWSEFARETVIWGSRLKSSNQPVPEGPVHDALAAVDRGSQLDSNATDWTKLRQELKELLEKPEDQKKPEQKNQQNQQQQQKQNQDQQKSDQQKQNEEQKNSEQNQEQQKEGSSKDSDQKSKSDQQKSNPQNSDGKDSESAFGDMKENKPPPQQETQKVGGVPEKKESDKRSEDPALTVPLQKLEQLKSNDSPAELFKLMEGQKGQAPQKTKKDW